jgi:hypothetical protein
MAMMVRWLMDVEFCQLTKETTIFDFFKKGHFFVEKPPPLYVSSLTEEQY